MIDLHHPLAVLANRMPWQEIEASLAHPSSTPNPDFSRFRPPDLNKIKHLQLMS
jgi:hypothetical protein